MTFFFYDLETSSGSPRNGRIMQFAGQRTNENLELIGEPINLLVRLSDDVIPEPDAILVHGIPPQKTLEEGLSEAEFAAYFQEHIAIEQTIFVGYNNIRFDDEFMRALCYRTFYDPYEWHWKQDRGRWDLLDAVRMMRALRPEGMEWPFLDDKPTVKLEEMAKANGILHDNAHDALSDVMALIELARKFKSSQPRLFDYLVQVKDKKSVAKLAESGDPFVYTSGRYDSNHLKTTVVYSLAKHPRRDSALVFDLRFDPSSWFDKSPQELATHWQARREDEIERLPVKLMQYNRCPAVAPLTVLDEPSSKRIGYDPKVFGKHLEAIKATPGFIEKVLTALDIVENEQQTRLPLDTDVDQQLYDGFWVDRDRSEMLQIRHADPSEFSELQKIIKNKRLREMMPLYKARNYRNSLTTEEHELWESYRQKKLLSGGERSAVGRAMARMQQIGTTRSLTNNQQYLLEELRLYIESVIPEPEQ